MTQRPVRVVFGRFDSSTDDDCWILFDFSAAGALFFCDAGWGAFSTGCMSFPQGPGSGETMESSVRTESRDRDLLYSNAAWTLLAANRFINIFLYVAFFHCFSSKASRCFVVIFLNFFAPFYFLKTFRHKLSSFSSSRQPVSSSS